MIYPWQTQQWQYLMQAKQANRLPHALLFSGEAGLGKLDFTQAFLHRLFCETISVPDSDCYTTHIHSPCHACRLITQQAHPHLLWITPEKKGQAIKIDQIRRINDFAYQSGFQDTYRIIIIHPADSMNMNSANALLKTLEEPPLGCLFILVSNQAALLPITIRSRCQTLFFPVPDKKIALTWLASQMEETPFSKELLLNIAKGAPLAALSISAAFLTSRQTLFEALYVLQKNQGCPLQIALSLMELDILPILDMLTSWLMDIVKLQFNISMIVNQDYHSQLTELMGLIPNDRMVEFIIYLQEIRKNIYQGIHLNKQLLLENILIRYLYLNNLNIR